MQISLRSRMIAGATAFVGAAAVAMTPIAPAVQLPALSATKAAVSLAAYENPLSALFGTVDLAVNYLINYNYFDAGADNWPSAGISDYVNVGVLPYSYWSIEQGSGPLPAITNIGLIPNFLTVPFPVGTQVVNNWVGYSNIAYNSISTAIDAGLNLLWAPVGLSAVIIQDLLSGNFADIPVQIQNSIAYAVGQAQLAVGAVVGGATAIVQNLVAKATAAIQVLAAGIPTALANLPRQLAVISASATTAITNITTALSTGNIQGAWNAAVDGLLGPTGVPGTLVNLTLGAGIQTGDVSGSASYSANFVPSLRNEVQTLGQGLSGALATSAPVAAAAVRSAAAAKTVKPAAAVAATEASATEASTAADSTAAPAKRGPAKAVRHAAAARAAAAK